MRPMTPAPIGGYERHETSTEAFGFLARYDEGEAIFLAGGRNAVQAIKSRKLQAR